MNNKFVNVINKTIQDVREEIDESCEEIVLIPAILSKNVEGEVSTLTPLSDRVMDNYSGNKLTPDNTAYTIKLVLEYISRVALNTGIQTNFNASEVKELLDILQGENDVTLIGNTTIQMTTDKGHVTTNSTTMDNEGLTMIIKDKIVVKIFHDNVYMATSEGIAVTGIAEVRAKDFSNIKIDLSIDGLRELNEYISRYDTIF